MVEAQDIYDTLSGIVEEFKDVSRGCHIKLDPKIWYFYSGDQHSDAVFVGIAENCTLHVIEGSEIVTVCSLGTSIYSKYKISGLSAELERVKRDTLSFNDFADKYNISKKILLDVIKTYFGPGGPYRRPGGLLIWPDEINDILDAVENLGDKK